jgi:hypothetical protein
MYFFVPATIINFPIIPVYEKYNQHGTKHVNRCVSELNINAFAQNEN